MQQNTTIEGYADPANTTWTTEIVGHTNPEENGPTQVITKFANNPTPEKKKNELAKALGFRNVGEGWPYNRAQRRQLWAAYKKRMGVFRQRFKQAKARTNKRANIGNEIGKVMAGLSQ